MLLKHIKVNYILFYGLFGHGAYFNSFFHLLPTQIFRTLTWVHEAGSHEQETMIEIILPVQAVSTSYQGWAIWLNRGVKVINWASILLN